VAKTLARFNDKLMLPRRFNASNQQVTQVGLKLRSLNASGNHCVGEH